MANGVPEPSGMYWATGIAVSLLVHSSAVAGAALLADRYLVAAPQTEITFTDEGSPTVQPERITTEPATALAPAAPVVGQTLAPEVAPQLTAEAVVEAIAPLASEPVPAETIQPALAAPAVPQAAEPLQPVEPSREEAPSAPSEMVAAATPEAVQPAEAEVVAPEDVQTLPRDQAAVSEVQPSAAPEFAREMPPETAPAAAPPEAAPAAATAEPVAPAAAADEAAPATSTELLAPSSSADLVPPAPEAADTLAAEPPEAVAAAPQAAPIEIPDGQAEIVAPVGSEALAPSADAESVAPSIPTEAASPAQSAEPLLPSSAAETAVVAPQPAETLAPIEPADGAVAVEAPQVSAPLADAETGPSVAVQPETSRPEAVQPEAPSTETVTSLAPETVAPSAEPLDTAPETVVPIQPETVAPVDPAVETALAVPRPDWSNDTPRQRYRKVVDLIENYAGGECFIALPALDQDGNLTLQTFGHDAAVENEFEETLGGIDGHGAILGNDTIADPQCQALSFTRAMKRYPDFSLVIDLDEAEMAHRPVLSGSVRNAKGAELYLFLIDEEGLVQSLEAALSERAGGVRRFSVPLTLTDPQQADARQLLMAVSTDRPLKLVDINERAGKFLPFLRNLIGSSGTNADVAVKGFTLR